MRQLFPHIIFLMCCFLALPVTCQTWMKTYHHWNHDIGRAVKQTPDGGFIIGVQAHCSVLASEDVWLVKTDAYGYVEWDVLIDKGTCANNIIDIEILEDGDFIITGIRECAASEKTGGFLMRTSSKGKVIWYKPFGTAERALGCSVKPTPDGGFVVAGWMTNTNAPGNAKDMSLVKFDASGNIKWQKRYGEYAGDEYGFAVDVTPDGGYVLAGSTGSYGTGYQDMCIVKTNDQGLLQWFKYFGFSGVDILNDIVSDTSGNLYVCGYSTNEESYYDTIVAAKLDPYGTIVWQNREVIGRACRMVLNDEGEVTIAGIGASNTGQPTDGILIHFNADGVIEWKKKYGSYNQDSFSDVSATMDGGYIATGVYNTPYLVDYVLVVKTDANGDIGPLGLSDPGLNDSDVVLYPNPVAGEATLELSGNLAGYVNSGGKLNVLIHDLSGQVVLRFMAIDAATLHLDCTGLMSGVYLYHIECEGKTVHTGKLIVQ